jgi:hypothetical protein
MSEKRTHTPGPWHPGHLGDQSTKCECTHVVSEVYFGGICTVHVDNGKRVSDGGNDAPPRHEAIANMHLIAAAPDMLAALKLAREALGANAARDAVDAAIAKAGGRT